MVTTFISALAVYCIVWSCQHYLFVRPLKDEIRGLMYCNDSWKKRFDKQHAENEWLRAKTREYSEFVVENERLKRELAELKEQLFALSGRPFGQFRPHNESNSACRGTDVAASPNADDVNQPGEMKDLSEQSGD